MDIFGLLDSAEIDYMRGGDTAVVVLADDVQVHIEGEGDMAEMVVWSIARLDPVLLEASPQYVITALTVSHVEVLPTLIELGERYGV